MKRVFLTILCVLIAVLLLATIVGPGMILNAVRQPEPAEGYTYTPY